jgi:hypothetical protein
MYAHKLYANLVPWCYRTLNLWTGIKHVKSVPLRHGMDKYFLCWVLPRKLQIKNSHNYIFNCLYLYEICVKIKPTPKCWVCFIYHQVKKLKILNLVERVFLLFYRIQYFSFRLTYTTHGRIPLDEWSASRRDINISAVISIYSSPINIRMMK